MQGPNVRRSTVSFRSSDVKAADGQTYELTPDIIKIERKVFKESSMSIYRHTSLVPC